jgi:CheY-like chemotaxis protein
LGLRGGTILIVDDEPDALHLFRRMLASSGHRYRVLLATDGRQALDSLQEHCPDLMLLDLVMPNMSGFQLLERKSQEPALRDVPIIVTSARDPLGQPIMSSALAVTRAGGLSAQQLLASIKAMSGILSASGQVDDPMSTKTPSAQPAYG